MRRDRGGRDRWGDPWDDPWEEAVPPGEREDPGATRARVLVAAVASVLLGVLLAWAGWQLVMPSGLLLVPSLVVAGPGTLVTLGALLAAGLRPRRPARWVLTVGSLAATAGATLWTVYLALPTTLVLGGAPTRQADAFLAAVRHTPASTPGAHRACRTVKTGSIGPLRAPYRECGTWTHRWHFVMYQTLAGDQPSAGLGYTNAGSGNFLDECYRHLVGKWWAYRPDTSGIGDCPFGYAFHGGP